MKLFASLREDAQQGWVWIKDPNIPSRSVVKISNPINCKSIYCEALRIDNNFLANYNLTPRLTISNSEDSIVISGWYRQLLGDLKTGLDVEIKVEKRNSWFGKFMACTHHPQIVVRVAAWLGLISIGLGLIGVAFGILSIAKF